MAYTLLWSRRQEGIVHSLKDLFVLFVHVHVYNGKHLQAHLKETLQYVNLLVMLKHFSVGQLPKRLSWLSEHVCIWYLYRTHIQAGACQNYYNTFSGCRLMIILVCFQFE